MPYSRGVVALALLLAAAGPAPALVNVFKIHTRHQVEELNKTLGGRVLDYTRNHDADRRLCSPALGEKRDAYVYLPPGYDGTTPFPAMLWLHGLGQDEKNFLDLVPIFDTAMSCGAMPRMVVVAPDGSISGKPSAWNGGSFYLNSEAGRFEDYVVRDVWAFALRSFALRPERGAHVLAGASMGGFGAYNLGFKHRDQFGVLVGILPPLDLRYADCRGRYFGPYDPDCVGRRERSQPHMAIGKFAGGLVRVQEKRLMRPLVGFVTHNTIHKIAEDSPIEMLDSYAIKPGEFALYVGYAGKDEFNLGAQAQHFIDVAAARGLTLTVQEVPDGNHSTATGVRMIPSVNVFLTRHVGAYVPAPKP